MRKTLVSIALFLVFCTTQAIGQAYMSPRLVSELDKAKESNTPVMTLVVLKDQVDIAGLDAQLYAMKADLNYRAYTVITTLQEKANATQEPLLAYLRSKTTTEVLNFQSFWIVNMIAVEATPSVIYEISRHADVGFIDIDAELVYDKPVKVSAAPMISPGGAEPGLKAINAHLMWAAGFTGAGRIVMNDDTGVNGTHPALSYKWRGNHVPHTQAWFYNGAPSTDTPTDCDNSSPHHGTHTMGTMCGLDPATNDTIGVAFGAEWIASNGICTSPHASWSIGAWQWAMNPDSNAGTITDMPDVISNSWYDPDYNAPLECSTDPAVNPYYNAIVAVEASGIAIVFSAGNSGPSASSCTAPKNMMVDLTTPFTVGAVNGNTSWPYVIASFSSRGPSKCTPASGPDSLRLKLKPEVTAPGVNVRSASTGTGYVYMDGTSMASPHVAGAIALLKQAHPGMTGKQLKMALYETARDLGDPGEDNTYGMGMIDVWAAHLSLADPDDPKPVTNATIYSDYLTPTSMTLTWTDPSEYEDGSPLTNFVIDIYRASTLVATVPSGVQTYTETGLNDGDLWSYDIYARETVHDSLSSKVTTDLWYVGGHPVPSAPTNFAATGYSNRAELSWTNPTTQLDGTPLDDFDSIRIYRNGEYYANVAAGVSAYTDFGVTGDYYTYKIQAIDNETPVNASAFTSEIQVYAGPQPDIAVSPDPLTFNVVSGETAQDSFYIYNTGDATLNITNIDAEDITGTLKEVIPTWTQEQKYTPDYPKGAVEPTFGAVTEGSGGPDPYGYRWKDSDAPGGPAVNFIDISATGTQITFSSNDDGYTAIPLPFPVKFYGNTYSGNLTVSTNGWVGYDTYTSSYFSNAAIPATALPNNIIAPFWDDLNGNNAGSKVVYQAVGNKFIVQWVNWNRYGNTGGNLNFEVILTQNSDKVEIQYATMTEGSSTTNSHTIGIESAGGTMGLQCVYNAAYVHSNMAIVFQKSVDWLTLSPTTGSVAPGDSMKVYANVNSTGLIGGLYKAKAKIEHNIPLVAAYEHPQIHMQVSGVPDIAVSPSSLNFGTQYITFPDTMTFNVQSTGTDSLEVTALTTTLPEYTVVTPVPFKVAVGASYPVKVAFVAATVGTYDDTVLVVSDGSSGDKKVALTAVAIDNPTMAIAPDTLFYELLTNELDTSLFTISNTGLGELRITGMETEEISGGKFVATWTQEQKYTPDYPKGAVEPTFGAVTEGSGGPDPYGYRWKDSDAPGGPAVNFIDISATGTQITFSSNDDGYTAIPLPFPVKFYGNTYSGNLTVSTNGWVGYDTYTSSYFTNAAIPATALPNNIIAPFWDDLNGNNAGSKVVYQAVGNKFIVQWVNWNRYGNTGGNLNFEVILTQNSDKVEIQYATMTQGSGTTNSHTIGIESAGGTMGLQCVYNAAYVHSNMAIVFQKSVPWLTYGPKTDTLGTGESMDVEVIANATGLLGGTYYAKFMVESNDPAHQPVWEKPIVKLRVIGVPDINVTQSVLDFGTNFVNVPDTMDITVGNNGTDVLSVTGLSLKQSLPEYSIITAAPFDVPIGGSVNVKVAFEAATAGTFVDTVVITSNDMDEPVVEVALTATTINPPIVGLSDTVLVGTVGYGAEDSTMFVIRNTGYSDLTFDIGESEDVFTYLHKINAVKPGLVNVPVRHAVVTSATSNTAEVSSTATVVSGHPIEATWDLQFQYDAGTVTGAQGNAAALYIPTIGEFWTSRWASALLHRWNPDGTLIEEFSVSGVTGVRGLTFDGTNVYAGINTAVIQVIDPNTRTLTGTISTTGAGNIRFITYDPVRDGFWVGNFTGNIFCVNRSGAVIATITTTLAGKYGAAYDGFSDGGPYLWVWDQGAGAGTPQLVHQFNLNTLTATGLTYDVAEVVGSGIAGGLFVSDAIVPGKATIGGMLQGDPINDQLWGLELAALGLPWADASPVTGTIAAGDTLEIKVYWHGTEAGLKHGYFGVSTNDPVTPMSNIRLQLDVVVGIGDNTLQAPKAYALYPNYPNPFNPTTTIKYDLKDAGKVSLKIYNILGQEVRTLVNKNETAGFKSVVWDGKDNAGRMVSSGLYIYRLETGTFTKSHKMMLLK